MVDKGATAPARRVVKPVASMDTIAIWSSGRVGTDRHAAPQKVLDLPFLCRHLGGDLLRQHVKRLLHDDQAIKLSLPHAVEQCRALDEIVA